MKKKILAILLTLVVVLSGMQTMPSVHAEGSDAYNALVAKLASTAKEDNVVVLPAGQVVVPENAELVVPKGKTLIIPYGEASFDVKKVETINPYADATKAEKGMYSELVLSKGATLTISERATVVVTGVTGADAAANNAQNVVTGGYGQITTETGSVINVNSKAKFENYGYVTGNGVLNALSGANVKDTFTVINFRGGTHTVSTVGGATGAPDEYPYPLNESGTGNIQVRAYYHAGSKLDGSVAIFARGEANKESFTWIGDKGVLRPTSGYIVKETTVPSTNNKVLNKESYKFVGDVTMAGSELVFQGYTLRTANFVYPIGGNTTIEVVSGTTTVKNAFKFMPGSKMVIDKDATVEISSTTEGNSDVNYPNGRFAQKAADGLDSIGRLVFYDYETFSAVDSNVTPAYSSGTEDAFLAINGKLVVNKGTAVAGKVVLCEGEIQRAKSDKYPDEIKTKEAGANSNDMDSSVAANIQVITHTADYKAIKAAKGHVWNEGVPTTKPECGKPVEMVYTCTACGATKTETFDALEHDYVAVKTDATCTEGGKTTYTCSLCKDSYTSDETAALGHSFTTYVSNNDAACGVNGTETATCDRCDATDERVVENSALPHTYAEPVVVAPTCTQEGYTLHECTKCDYFYKSDVKGAIDHDFANYVANNDATCTENGTETATCALCGDVTDTREVANTAKGHAYGEWSVSKAVTCTVDGEERRDCANCDEFETKVIKAEGHISLAEESVTAPTCTEKGYTTYTCSACKESYNDNYTSALGHEFKNYVANGDATCTEDGTKTAKCERCDATDKVADKDSALGHKYEAVVTAPTCTAEGYTTYTCSVCKDSYTADETAKVAHKYEAVVTAPTCTAEGYTTYTCSACKDSYEADKVDALGHKYDAVVTAPTCTAEGYTTYTCSVCGDSYTADETAKVAHEYEAVVTDATCTVDGKTTYTCTACGDTYSEVIKAKGHTYDEGIVTVEPTCTEAGRKIYVCQVCEEVKEEEVKALGHAWDDGVVIKEATATEAGEREFTCATCGDKAKIAIPATGETPTEKPSQPTAPQTADTANMTIWMVTALAAVAVFAEAFRRKMARR